MEIWHTGCEVGEGPYWDAATKRLFCIDVRNPRLMRFDPTGNLEASWSLPEPVGAFALLQYGSRAIVALKSGLAILDLGNGSLLRLFDPEPDKPFNRLNEGKVSPCGRYFVFGSMHDQDPDAETGACYSLSWRGTLRTLATGLRVTNGLAWSPDGLTLFMSDSRASVIWSCAWDAATGTIGQRRVLTRLSESQGRPDGAAMDQDGYYWSAGVSAGVLNRIDMQGTITQTLKLPVQAPTMPAFGEDGRLYVTSHRRVKQPHELDGSIVVLSVAQEGVPQRRFHFDPSQQILRTRDVS